ALSGTVALVVGMLFVALVPDLSRQLSYLHREGLLAQGFIVSLALWGVFALQDAALTATRNAPWIPLENAAFGVLKIAALPALLALGVTHGVFLSWALPIVLLVVPVTVFVFRRALPARSIASPASELAQPGLRQAARFLAQDYLASVFTQATLTALPLLVIASLGPHASAYFAMPFTIAIAFDTF